MSLIALAPRIAQSASITGSLALASFLPPLLGLWQAEYGVSYGYGLATAVSGALLLRRDLPMPVALHAGCLCFYGVRREFLKEGAGLERWLELEG